MNKTNKINWLCKILLFAVFFVSMILCSCVSVSNGEKKATITFNDQVGRSVILDEPANRISSAYYISTTTLIALDQKNKLVTVEDKAESRPIYEICDPELLKLPSTGNREEFDLEVCLSQKTDIVLIPKGLVNYNDKFEELNLKFCVVVPEDVDSLIQMIYVFGQICGCTENANILVNYLNSKFEELKDLQRNTEKPSVFMSSNSSLLFGASGSSFQNELIEKAGCKNIYCDQLSNDVWINVEYEDIILKNPDYIILPSDAKYSVEDVLNDNKLMCCNAVKNRNVYKMPGGVEAWDSPVPASFIGAYWLANITHQGSHSNFNYLKQAIEFYEKFYKVNVAELLS